jgi:hypothetical protein
MYKLVFRSWILANLFHPVAIIVAYVLFDDFRSADLGMMPAVYGMLLLFSLCLSIPTLIICCCIINILVKLKIDTDSRFCIWLISNMVVVVFNAVMLMAVFNRFFFVWDITSGGIKLLALIAPSVVCMLLASCFCFNQFSGTIKTYNYETTRFQGS